MRLGAVSTAKPDSAPSAVQPAFASEGGTQHAGTFCITLKALGGECSVIDCSPSTRLHNLKVCFRSEHGVACWQQQVFRAGCHNEAEGEELLDEMEMQELGLNGEATLYVVVKLKHDLQGRYVGGWIAAPASAMVGVKYKVVINAGSPQESNTAQDCSKPRRPSLISRTKAFFAGNRNDFDEKNKDWPMEQTKTNIRLILDWTLLECPFYRHALQFRIGEEASEFCEGTFCCSTGMLECSSVSPQARGLIEKGDYRLQLGDAGETLSGECLTWNRGAKVHTTWNRETTWLRMKRVSSAESGAKTADNSLLS